MTTIATTGQYTQQDIIKGFQVRPIKYGEITSLFRVVYSPTTQPAVEISGSKQSLIPATPRGTLGTVGGEPTRNLYTYNTARFARQGSVLKAAWDNVRQLGTNELVSPESMINDKMFFMREDIALTVESFCAGVLNNCIAVSPVSTQTIADYTTIAAMLTANVALSNAATDVVKSIQTAEDASVGTLGGTSWDGTWTAYCGATFIADLVGHAKIVDKLQYNNAGPALLKDNRGSFTISNTTFKYVRSAFNGTAFVSATEAILVPNGIDPYQLVVAPSSFNANVMPVDIFDAEVELSKFRLGWDILMEANVLPVCTMPGSITVLTRT
jgi:hypothetical protein